MVGKEKDPFLVVLPNYNCQELIIRDYGPGLTPDQIRSVYTVLFESTKEDNNELGGCFGLGSKSPFCYTDSFSIISYVDGKVYYYTVFRNDERIPEVAPLGVADTTEPNGVEIKVPISPSDISAFKSAAESVYKWFETKPTIKGQNYVNITRPAPANKGKDWEFHSHSYYSSYAVMANAAYEIPTAYSNELGMPHGTILFFEIGEVEPEPSRESLSLNKKTKEAIRLKYEGMQKEICKDFMDKLQGHTDFYSFVETVRNYPQNPFISKNNLKWKDSTSGKEYPYGETLRCDPIKFKLSCLRTQKDTYTTDYITPSNSNKIMFIEDDNPKNKAGKLRTIYNESYRAYMYPEGLTKEVKEAFLVPDRLIVKLSQIEPLKYATSRVSGYGKTSVVKLKDPGWNRSEYNSYFWENAEVDIKNDSGFYLPTYNNAVTFNNKNINVNDVWQLRGILKDVKSPVYGFRPSIKFDNSKWSNYLDHLIQSLKDKLSKEDYVSFESIAEDWNETYYSKKSVMSLYGTFIKNIRLINDPQFAVLLKEIQDVEKMKKLYDKGSELLEYGRKFGVTQTPKKIDLSGIKTTLKAFSDKYSILRDYSFKASDVSELKVYMKGK